MMEDYMGEVNFRIIENPQPNWYDKYDEFVELYNNPEITIVDLRNMLGWTVKTYTRARLKALEEGKIVERRSLKSIQNNPGRPRKEKVLPKNYYYRSSLQKYIISKRITIDGEAKAVYFGAYEDKEDCIRIIEELRKCDWDKSQLKGIKKRLGIL